MRNFPIESSKPKYLVRTSYSTVSLSRGQTRFNDEDRNAIKTLAGGHPFLLQVVSSEMWHAYDEGFADPGRRYLEVGKAVYRNNRAHFSDSWQNWTPAMKKAFTTVSLVQTECLLPDREFLTDPFLEGLRDFQSELEELSVLGLVAMSDEVEGGWRVVPQAMLWWLADELVDTVRNNEEFEKWLRAQEMDGVLTRGERDAMSNVVKKALGMLEHGAITLIETFAKGAIK